MEQDNATEIVKAIVRQTGLSATKIARIAGLAPSTLTRIYPVPSVDYSLSSRTIAKLKNAFPAVFHQSPEGIHPLDRVPAFRGPAHAFAAETTRRNEAVFVASLVEERDEGQNPIPGDFELYENTLSAIDDPVLLPLDPSRHFAIYIRGDAMEPRFRAGERVIIDRLKPVKLNSPVLARLRLADDKQYLCIAQLVERDRNLVTFVQYKDDVRARVHRSAVVEMLPIVSLMTEEF